MMKTKILFFTTLTILILSSCNERSTIQNNSDYRIDYDNSSYNINNEDDLRDFILEVIGDRNVILQQFSKEVLLDENSTGFDAITAKYSIGETTVNLVIPLSSVPNRFNNEQSFVADCTMNCSALTGCSGCNQILYEPCKRQTCTCFTNSSWGCNSSISF